MARKFKTPIEFESTISLPNKTASRVLIIDGSNEIVESSVTTTELGHLSGVTSALQTQLDAKVDDSEKGAANGIATLDGTGKLPASQLTVSAMEYQGTWNASTNSPSLADGAGNQGDIYIVSVAGTQDLGSGSITYGVGDWVLYNGSTWEKVDNTDAVTSVNSQTGAVVLDTDDISEGTTNFYYTEARFNSSFSGKSTTDLSEGTNLYYTDARFDTRLGTKTTTDLAEGTNLYFTDERAQDAVGTILTDTASIDFTYNDVGNQITADVLPAGVDHDSLQNFVANEHIDHSSVSITTAADSGLSGGGDITASRSLSVDISGTTAETSADDADLILIYDNSGTALKSMTRANFLSGVGGASAGDIEETSFSFADNQAVAANVTGLAFANGTVRSFDTQVSIVRASTYEVYTLKGIQKAASWEMSVESTGDDCGLTFTITAAGQVQYTSTSTGSGGTIKFRAATTSV